LGSTTQEDNKDDWITVKKSKHSFPATPKYNRTDSTKHSQSYYHHLSHLYATLPEFAADPPKQSTALNKTTITRQHATPPLSFPSHQKHKAHNKFLEHQLKQDQRNQQAAADDEFFDHHIQ
jgi:hypothetical protein